MRASLATPSSTASRWLASPKLLVSLARCEVVEPSCSLVPALHQCEEPASGRSESSSPPPLGWTCRLAGNSRGDRSCTAQASCRWLLSTRTCPTGKARASLVPPTSVQQPRLLPLSSLVVRNTKIVTRLQQSLNSHPCMALDRLRLSPPPLDHSASPANRAHPARNEACSVPVLSRAHLNDRSCLWLGNHCPGVCPHTTSRHAQRCTATARTSPSC